MESIISDRDTPIRNIEDLEAILFDRSSKRKISFDPLEYDTEDYRCYPASPKKAKIESALIKKAARRCLFSDK